jgi:hypothetical protein
LDSNKGPNLYLIYLDEQIATHSGHDFTAVHGLFVEARSLREIRERYYSNIEDVLGGQKSEGQSRRVGHIPVLHGSNLLPEHSDRTRIAAVELLLDSFVSANGFFFRLGYYHVPIIRQMTKEQRVEFCAIQLQIMMNGTFDHPYAIIHEIDKKGLQRAFRFTTDNLGMYYQVGQETVSINIECLVGHYVASASDIGC